MPNSPAIERIHSDTLEEEVLSTNLPSGLRVFLCPKAGFKKRYACYSVLYGSVDSTFIVPGGQTLEVPDGIAHFLEHTLFETEEGNASDFFASMGAYSNAATSFTTTSYLFAATENFYESLEKLLGFVENPVFLPERVEKERGIIEQEIRMYQDSPHWVGYMGLLENLFVKHPLRIDIAGTVESIGRIDSATLHDCYRTFYHPSNMILFVVGDVDPRSFFPFVAEKSRHGTESADRPDGYRVSHVYPREPQGILRSETRKTMQVATPKLLLGFKEVEVPARGEEFVLHDFASSLALEILFGKSSETYELLYEKGLILDDFGASYGMGAGIGYGLVGGETPEPDRLREMLIGRLRKLLDEGIAPEDFERSRRAFLGSFIRGFNSLEYIASHYTYFKFHDFDLFRTVDVLSRLDRDLLEERIRGLLDPSNCASFVILPQAR